jgi:hypothetical protein
MSKWLLALGIARTFEGRPYDLTEPIVAAKLRERFGENVPMNEPVISPAAMFGSPLLTTVAER